MYWFRSTCKCFTVFIGKSFVNHLTIEKLNAIFGWLRTAALRTCVTDRTLAANRSPKKFWLSVSGRARCRIAETFPLIMLAEVLGLLGRIRIRLSKTLGRARRSLLLLELDQMKFMFVNRN